MDLVSVTASVCMVHVQRNDRTRSSKATYMTPMGRCYALHQIMLHLRMRTHVSSSAGYRPIRHLQVGNLHTSEIVGSIACAFGGRLTEKSCFIGTNIFLPKQQFLKDPVFWARPADLPPTILSAIDPATHTHIRGILAPAFTPRVLRGQEPSLRRYVNLMVQRLLETLLEKPKTQEADGQPTLTVTQ